MDEVNKTIHVDTKEMDSALEKSERIVPIY